jgi:hypothetical protein
MVGLSFAAAVLVGTLAAANADEAGAIAARILDDKLPADQRQALIEKHPDQAAELVAAMTADLPADDVQEEYRRIPWIWRVAVAAGKRNDEKVLRSLLDVSLPKPDEELRDWQAVVIGGGVINGLSLAGKWPGERIGDLLHGDEALQKRWQQSLIAAAKMADDEQVKSGTRYDALRMIALDPVPMRLEQLAKYLAQDQNAELQMGAVSGLSDVDGPETAPLLVRNFARLTERNRSLAIDALLRNDARAEKLLLALEKGLVPADSLSADQTKRLRQFSQ